MKVAAKVLLSAMVVFVLIIVVFTIRSLPFFRVADSFEETIEEGKTVIKNKNFGIEFTVNSKCRLKNQYSRALGSTLWDAVLLCDGDNQKNVLHLFVSKETERMIGGAPYHNTTNIYYDSRVLERDILRIRSNDGQLALLIHRYGNPKSWGDVLSTIVAYGGQQDGGDNALKSAM